MINWGILGLGRMGLAFANAINETSNSKLLSIASESGKTFKNFENENYESLIKNKNIDAIYIASLNNTHVDLIKKILNEKKKILCEKPVSTSLNDFFEVKKMIFYFFFILEAESIILQCFSIYIIRFISILLRIIGCKTH